MDMRGFILNALNEFAQRGSLVLFSQPWFNIIRLLIIPLLICCGSICLIWLWRKINGRYAVDQSTSHHLVISNNGNIPSTFLLCAISDRLSVHFFEREAPLLTCKIPDEADRANVKENVSRKKAKKIDPLDLASLEIPDIKGNPADIAAISEKAKEGAQKMGSAASLFGTLGTMLPGAIGETAKKQSALLKEAQQNAAQTARIPDSVMQKTDGMKTDLAKLSVPKEFFPGKALPNKADLQNARGKTGKESLFNEKTQTTLAKNAMGTDEDKRFLPYYLKKLDLPGHEVAATRVLGADERMDIAIKIRLKNRTKYAVSELYSIKILQIPIDDMETSIPPRTVHGVAVFKAYPSWRIYLPHIVTAAIGFLLAILLIFITGLLFF